MGQKGGSFDQKGFGWDQGYEVNEAASMQEEGSIVWGVDFQDYGIGSPSGPISYGNSRETIQTIRVGTSHHKSHHKSNHIWKKYRNQEITLRDVKKRSLNRDFVYFAWNWHDKVSYLHRTLKSWIKFAEEISLQCNRRSETQIHVYNITQEKSENHSLQCNSISETQIHVKSHTKNQKNIGILTLS